MQAILHHISRILYVWLLIPPRKLYKGSGSTIRLPDGHDFAGPYVTSVGGTAGNPEFATVYSGGGFSDYFPILNFQKVEVGNYVRKIRNNYKDRYNYEDRYK